jgi:hypothetical protein
MASQLDHSDCRHISANSSASLKRAITMPALVSLPELLQPNPNACQHLCKVKIPMSDIRQTLNTGKTEPRKGHTFQKTAEA